MKTLGIVCAGLLAACEVGAADSTVELLSVAQDAATSVVYGMPKAIAESGLTNEVLPLKDVAQSIIKNVGVQ